MTIYEIETYKQGLRSVMSFRQQQFGGRFTFEKMALACGIQKTYLSKVLNSTSHLNPDQLYSACEYLKLNTQEIDFFLLLREMESSTNPKRSLFLKNKITEIQRRHMKTESVIESNSLTSIEDNRWEYYTDVDLQLVHMFFTIPKFCKNPHLIGPLIGINEERLQSIIFKLQEWKIIQIHDGLFSASNPKLHLPEDSPIFVVFRILNRIKTIEKIRNEKPDKSDDYFFSVIFSSDKEMQKKIKVKFLNLLKEIQKDIIKSNPEEVYQINIDLFKWS